MRKFSQRLKELRAERELSTMQLCKKVGISVAAINRWENGINDIKGDQLIVLAQFFGVTTDYLLGLEDPDL